MGTNTRQLGNLQFEKLNSKVVEWQSTVTSDGSTVTQTVAGRGYFIDNSSAAGLVKLPAVDDSNPGDTIIMFDASASALRKITKANFSPAISLTYTAGSATGDGSTTVFTINSGRAVADVLVIVNGVVLVPTTDYTISGTNLTFATAPGASAEIQFRYLPIEG